MNETGANVSIQPAEFGICKEGTPGGPSIWGSPSKKRGGLEGGKNKLGKEGQSVQNGFSFFEAAEKLFQLQSTGGKRESIKKEKD